VNDDSSGSDERNKRRWYERPLWTIWLFLEIIFLQSAFASYQELEPRAAILFAAIFITLLLTAATILFIRRNRLL
jgi:polyferredoxin